MNLVFKIESPHNIKIQLKRDKQMVDAQNLTPPLKNNGNFIVLRNKRIISRAGLTINQGFDIMLIKTLDNLLHKNKIERLSLKSVKISGKVEHKALWGMMLNVVKIALES